MARGFLSAGVGFTMGVLVIGVLDAIASSRVVSERWCRGFTEACPGGVMSA